MLTYIRKPACHIVVIALAATLGTAAIAQNDPCDRDKKTHKLKIKVKNNIPTKVVKGVLQKNADNLEVCRGDTVEWKLKKNVFFVKFSDPTLFDTEMKTSSNKKIVMTVVETAKREDPYKYDVGIEDGGVLDPVIIVR